MEKADKAIENFTRVLDLDEKYVLAYIRRGWVHFHQGDMEAASKDWTKAIEADPEKIVSYQLRGMLALLEEKYEDAIKDFTRAIALYNKDIENHSNATSYTGRGTTYYTRGKAHNGASDDKENNEQARSDFDQAVKDFTEAINLDYKYLAAYYGRLEVYNILGEKKKADTDNTMVNLLITTGWVKSQSI